jgi:pyruvate dehydrogenase E2 component (dihydrolipoamide acetyltransferase)
VVVVVASAALADAPVLNGTFEESTHHVRESQDIALVADVDGRPVAGVVSDAANRSLAEVVDRRQSIDGDAGAANRGTFTVANAAETTETGRLINPPAVAALEVDPTGQRAVPRGDGSVDLQPLVTVALTYDTRAVGAGEARAFVDGFLDRAADTSALVLGSYRGRE